MERIAKGWSRVADWLIDETGVAWPAESPRLRAVLWASQSTPVLCRFAVTNLGFAHVATLPRALAVIWRPTFTTKETLVGLVQLMADQADTRVVLSTLGRDWSDRIFGSIADATASVLREFETARCESGGYFKASVQHPDRLASESHLGRILAAATQAKSLFDPVSLWQMLEHCAGGRFILTEPQGDRGPLTILAWGKGYQSMNRSWIDQAPGRNFEDQPDANYAKRGARAYRSVAATGAPVIEDVDASTWWPGRGRTRLQYTRLILPLTLNGGRTLVLSTAQSSDAT